MGAPLGNASSVRSAPIVTSCNIRTVGSGVLCWIRPKAISRGSTGRLESAVGSWKTNSLEVIADSCPWRRRGRRRSSHCCKPLRTSSVSNFEIDASLRGRELGSRGTFTFGRRYPSARWRYNRLRRLNACCSEQWNVWISDSPIVTSSHDL
jgi:hypothetical protein